MKGQCKPLLAKLQEEYPKIKNEPVTVIDGTINYLFALLNVQFKPEERAYRDAQTLVLSEFLQDRFKHLTLEEVKQAFKMYASKEFPELKTFRILDCISLGEILNTYVERRNQNLHVYNQKLLSNKQKSIGFNPSNEEKLKIRAMNLSNLFDSLKSNKTDYSAFIYFDELKAKGKIILSKEETRELYFKEAKNYEAELKNDVFRNPLNKISLTNFQQDLKTQKWNPIVVNRSKSSAVSNYLMQFKTLDEFIKQFE